MEAKSKKKGKKNKSGGEQKSVSSSQPSPQSPSNPLPTNVSPAKTTQKSGIKATSTGLPVPPPTTPKLEKATPYEFLQAWNSLKNVTEIQPYADLLKQIPPKDLPLGKIFLKNLLMFVSLIFLLARKFFSVEF